MNEWGKIITCTSVYIKKAVTNIRWYLAMVTSLIFHYYAFHELGRACEVLSTKVCIWLFPFYLGGGPMFLTFGGLAMLLFCDFPQIDSSAAFYLIRVGKKGFLISQILTVFCVSALYTAINAMIPIALLAPYADFSNDWGKLFRSLLSNPEILYSLGIRVSFALSAEVMSVLTPLSAFGISILLFWLGTSFLGLVILSFQILFGNGAGLKASGILTCIGYFSSVLGRLTYGRISVIVSPVSWSSISLLDWDGGAFTARKVILLYIGIDLILCAFALAKYCRRDIRPVGR